MERQMPEYDYQCEKCERTFVKEHPMAFRGKVKCPYCGSFSTVKVFHAAGVVFKGSGFYVTDSGNGHRTATSVSSNGDATTETVKPAENSNGKKTVEKPAADDKTASGKDPKPSGRS
jgi:putative FmdB family regulatory protein